MSDVKPALRNHTVHLIETHGDADEVTAWWPARGRVIITRDKVQINGATVALFDDGHYYPTVDPRNPSRDDGALIEDAAANEVWIEFGDDA